MCGTIIGMGLPLPEICTRNRICSADCWRPGCIRFFSEQAYERAAEPKELYVVEDAEHIYLYDRTDRIPFDKIEGFFKENLK